MSRIGKLPIPLPQGVKVTLAGDSVSVQGPKGSLSHSIPSGISAEIEEGKLILKRRDDAKERRALHGMMRAILANSVSGVTQGFNKELEIQGVGYRAQVTGKTVSFNLGYTHAIEFPIPDGIAISIERQTRISISGIDKQRVGQVAAKIRALRPPDVYKGKGVRYVGEVVRKKAGKTGAK